MLGKGLESLIPPHQSDVTSDGTGQARKQNNDADGDGAVVQDSQIQGATVAPARKIEPAEQPRITPQVKAGTPAERKETSAKKPAESVFHIEVAKIKPNPNQPRRNFSEEGLRELASSIREFGFIQPLVVSKAEKETPTGVDVEYQLIAGERRLLAAKLLGLLSVPAIVRNVDLEQEKLELAVIENIQRQDLNPVETARAFQRLQEEFRMTQREVASKLGKSREVVANAVRLLDLPPYIQEALEKGQISESHGRLLLTVAEPATQKTLFDDLVLSRMTTRELKERVRAQSDKQQGTRDKEKISLSPELKALEEKLSSELGAPVKIERNANTGKVVITFYSEEELQNIARRLGGNSKDI